MSRTGYLLASSFLSLALAAPGAFAQDGLYPGSNVSVGPVTGGARVLLYPGGKYERIQPRLLQPGAPYPGSGQTIHLHMPGKAAPSREAARRAPAQTQPVTQSARTAPQREAPVKQAAAAPAVAPATSPDAAPIPFSFDGSSRPVMKQAAPQEETKTATQAAPVPKEQKIASLPPKPAPQTKPETPSTPAPQAAQKPAQKKTAGEPDLTKRSQILFPHDATEPAPVAAAKLTALAGDLSTALDAGADRVQLDAYGGKPGDKSSDARRISLKRALTIRQILIDNGVPSSRIDVRAMGGVDDNGPHDRVDVYTRG